MKEVIEISICWVAMLIGLVVCLTVAWRLMKAVRQGTRGRLAATAILPLLGLVPSLIACAAKMAGDFAGYEIYTIKGGNDGLLVGVGILGILMALGVAAVFGVIMIYQKLTDS